VRNSKIAEFEDLFREQYAPLSRYVYRMVGGMDDTLEIVQETFLRMWKLDRRPKDDDNQAGLLFRTAHNLVIDMLRRRHVRERHARECSGKVLMFPPTPEQMALGSERRRLTQSALQQLEPKQREVLRLRAAGFSYGEIARILDLNCDSVGPTLTRALRKFKTLHEGIMNDSSKGSRDESAGR
jgi:RNA polymerase sigma-70 factor (ECF subfamily)